MICIPQPPRPSGAQTGLQLLDKPKPLAPSQQQGIPVLERPKQKTVASRTFAPPAEKFSQSPNKKAAVHFSPDWSYRHARVLSYVKKHQLMPYGAKVLIAVSGGQDSLCLTKMLKDMRHLFQWHLGIAHCDHRWRPDSSHNAEHVENLARDLHLDFHVHTATDSINSEAAARQWRYNALADMAASKSYTHVATGHTSSDVAETVMMSVIRGTGIDGLCSLHRSRPLSPDVQLVRPMLCLSRLDTAHICTQFSLPVYKDSTNTDISFRRNRVRQELLPYLQQYHNPRVEEALLHLATIAEMESEFMQQEAEQLLQRATHKLPPACVRRHVIKTSHLALQRRVLRDFLRLNLGYVPSFDEVDEVVGLLGARNRSRSSSMRGGVTANVSGEFIVLQWPVQRASAKT